MRTVLKYLLAFSLLFLPTSYIFAQCTASDSFSGTGALSTTNWTQTPSTNFTNDWGTAIPFTITALQQVSAKVQPLSPLTMGMAIWSGTSCTPPADQYSEVVDTGTISSLGDSGPMVRASSTGNGYVWSFTQSAIFKMVNFNPVAQVAELCPLPTVGSTYRLVANGPWLYGYENGKLVCQGGDATYPTGSPGVIVDWSYYQGDWVSGTVYSVGQVVTQGGVVYYYYNTSTTSSTAAPSDSSIWGPEPNGLESFGNFKAGYSPLQPVTFSYPTGTYAFTPLVAVLHNPSAAAMCVTTDGSVPTATVAGTCSNGTQIADGASVNVTATETLSAIATKALFSNSSSTSATYTMRAGGTTTWYVRPDGGTRFSSNVPFGQCNGNADASYTSVGGLTNAQWSPSTVYAAGAVITDSHGFYESTVSGLTSGSAPIGPTWGSSTTTDGTGSWTKGAAYPVNQACAFNDVRLFWTDASFSDGTTFPGWGWIGAGGDRYLVRGSIGTGVSYLIGPDNPSATCDATGCWGVQNLGPDAGPVPMYPGDPTHHTQFVGENYDTALLGAAYNDSGYEVTGTGSCDAKHPEARTQLHGGWGVGHIFNVSNSSYTDVACLDITDFSQCGKAGDPIACDGTQSFAIDGIALSNLTNNLSLTDIRIHGLNTGIHGAPGGNMIAEDLVIRGNASSGWNSDDGTGTTGHGTMLVQNFDISWNGCVEQYPIVNSLPYTTCTDAGSGGYGDGFGSSTVESVAPGWQVHFDNGVSSYNTQDGLDALHINGVGSTMTDTRVFAYGNEGQQLKVGGATATIQNSVIVGNCYALAQGAPTYNGFDGNPKFDNLPQIPGTIPGFNAPIDTACRAGNTAVLINVTPGLPATYQNNTMISEGNVGLEVEYATYDTGVNNTLKYDNNVFIGVVNPDPNFDVPPSVMYGNTDLNMLTNPGSSFSNNATYGQKINWLCPNTQHSEVNPFCTDPELIDETYNVFSFGNMAPKSGSPLLGAGVVISSVTKDILGSTRPSPPTIGAYEASAPLQVITVNPSATTLTLGIGAQTSTYTAKCSYGDGSLSPCTPVWTDSNAHTSITSGVVTALSAGIDTITATINSIFGTAVITINPTPPFITVQGVSFFGIVTR